MSKNVSLMHLLGDRYVYYEKNVTESVKEKFNFEDCRLYNTLYDIACSRFVWEGLPPSIESRHIEKFMLEHGVVMFTKDPTLGLICLPCHGTGDLNIYGEYTKYRLLGHGGKPLEYEVFPYIRGKEDFLLNEEYKKEDKKPQYGVLLKPSIHNFPFIENVRYYSMVMEDFELSYSMNLQQQRFTNIIPTDEMNESSVKRMLGKIYDYEPFVLASKDFTEDVIKNFKTIDTGVKYLVDKLWEDKQKVFSEYLTLCGINNNPIVKKERMITDEVNSNNEYIEMMINKELKSRQDVAKQLSEIYGENITVKRVKDFIGGGENGETHTTTLPVRKGQEF